MSELRTKTRESNYIYANMGTNIVGDRIDMLLFRRLGLQVSYNTQLGDDGVGEVIIQVSNDAENWVEMVIYPEVPVSGEGTSFIDVETGARYARMVYNRTSGNGTLKASFALKQF
jgi:hypothetical protein